jgi:hypothetical protein
MVDLEVKFLGFNSNFVILIDSMQCKSIPLVEYLLGYHRTYLLQLIKSYSQIQKLRQFLAWNCLGQTYPTQDGHIRPEIVSPWKIVSYVDSSLTFSFLCLILFYPAFQDHVWLSLPSCGREVNQALARCSQDHSLCTSSHSFRWWRRRAAISGSLSHWGSK